MKGSHYVWKSRISLAPRVALGLRFSNLSIGSARHGKFDIESEIASDPGKFDNHHRGANRFGSGRSWSGRLATRARDPNRERGGGIRAGYCLMRRTSLGVESDCSILIVL